MVLVVKIVFACGVGGGGIVGGDGGGNDIVRLAHSDALRGRGVAPNFMRLMRN